jgi:FAD/FMN-containing dehydrogenase
MGRCGLACDNTLSYDVVVASGELIRASASQHADLFWALKGGGGNFGIVTSITYRMYPISTVISGMVLHPLAHACEVLRFYEQDALSGYAEHDRRSGPVRFAQLLEEPLPPRDAE